LPITLQPAIRAGGLVAIAALAFAVALSAGGRTQSNTTAVIFYAVLLVAMLAIVLRPVRVVEDRGAWLAFALGTALWVGGELFIGLALDRVERPMPSVADVCHLGAYVLYGIGVLQLLRSRVTRVETAFWLDGLIVALAAAALGAAVLVEPVLRAADGEAAATLTRLAYPTAGVVLLALLVAVMSVAGRHPGRAPLLLCGGLATLALADGFYVLQTLGESYRPGALLDILWPAALVLVALAAWAPDRAAAPAGGRPVTAVPVGGAIVAIAVVTAGTVTEIGAASVALAAMALAAVVARLLVSFRQIDILLARTREEADTDVLTDLPNRRKLLVDLDGVIEQAPQGQSHVLALFDLDGFKAYNDAFGHPAGDLLLARLGERLATMVGDRGVAYRLGGDEFCLLARADRGAAAALLEQAVGALHEIGAGFEITCSYGAVFLPTEAREGTAAIRLADERLYAAKRHRHSERHRAHEPLLQALYERAPNLREHVRQVVELAVGVGQELGLDPSTTRDLELSAELHDIGKLAVPDEILLKSGPLTEREWEFILQHPLVGERIVSASPTLTHVGRAIRSTHERWDGSGYPDGLTHAEIPLAARIIAACDAVYAMVEQRPHQTAVGLSEALAELERCAGSQFDPEIVDAVNRVMERREAEPAAVGAAGRTAA
jgi:diguanylate cyclase (GGDEF)-like protein